MDDAATAQPAHPAGTSAGITAPLLLWLLVQLLALLLAAGRVPLAAQYPQPAETLAAHVVAVVQVTAAALLMPYLMRDAAASVAVVATAWPFMVLAGVLSALPAARVAAAGASVTAWLVALALVNQSLPSAWQAWGVCLAALLSVGCLTLSYLSAEFQGGAAGWLRAFPPSVQLRQLNGSVNYWNGWAIPAAVAAAATARLIARRRHGQVIHNS